MTDNIVNVLMELIQDCRANSQDKGFWDGKDYVSAGPEKIALMHSELSEALEAMRDSRFVGDHSVSHELADTVIRIFDYAGKAGLPLAEDIIKIMARNRERPHKHGGKLF